MTRLTTIAGLIPLAFGRAAIGGGPYYFPLARTVMGGLISSTVLTLIVLPYINLGVERAAEWARNLWRASDPKHRVQPAVAAGASEAPVPAMPAAPDSSVA